MRAAILNELGATPRLGDFEAPSAQDDAMVVDVVAAGLNPVDLTIASGRFYAIVPPVPSVVGREGVGRDPDGQRGYFPFCVPPFGSLAERALVLRQGFVPLPDDVDAGAAVGVGTAGLAAWIPLTRVARLSEGEKILVLGASGAVGQLAVQLARILGAGRIVAAARSESGRSLAMALGADAATGLTPEELTNAADGGYDVVLDMLWGEPALAALGAIAPWGRMVQVGHAAGSTATVPAAALRSRCASVTGYTTGLVEPPTVRAAYLELIDHIRRGQLTVNVERYALEDAPDAWVRQAQSPHGKLVIVP